MTSRFSKGGRLIDRTKRLSFKFNGKNLFAYGGDTLASALLANNHVLIGRSFKYHRPRGIVSSGIEEPNALVSLGSGGNFEPNRSATTLELFDGVDTAKIEIFEVKDFEKTYAIFTETKISQSYVVSKTVYDIIINHIDKK